VTLTIPISNGSRPGDQSNDRNRHRRGASLWALEWGWDISILTVFTHALQWGHRNLATVGQRVMRLKANGLALATPAEMGQF
jgi:hypothetical protein